MERLKKQNGISLKILVMIIAVVLIIGGVITFIVINNVNKDKTKGSENNNVENSEKSTKYKYNDEYTQIDVSKFDKSKYDGSLYISGYKFQYPIKVSDLQSKSFVVKADEEIESKDWDNASIKLMVNGKEEFIKGVEGERIINKSNETAQLKDCSLAQLFYDYSKYNYVGVDEKSIQEIENITIKDVVKKLGAPSSISRPLEMEEQLIYRYNYGNYELTYHFLLKKDNTWKPISFNYVDGELYKD